MNAYADARSLRLALREVRDQMFPFIGDDILIEILDRHQRDPDPPTLASLTHEAVESAITNRPPELSR